MKRYGHIGSSAYRCRSGGDVVSCAAANGEPAHRQGSSAPLARRPCPNPGLISSYCRRTFGSLAMAIQSNSHDDHVWAADDRALFNRAPIIILSSRAQPLDGLPEPAKAISSQCIDLPCSYLGLRTRDLLSGCAAVTLRSVLHS